MQKRVLKNGLTILFDKRKSDSVTLNIFVKVGSNNENSNILGVSHFLEHMLFEGTKKRTALELSNEIEKVGGYMNAATTNEYTYYFASVPKSYFDVALDILSDMVLNSKFEDKTINKERQVILDEIGVHDDEPSDYQWTLFNKTLFKKLPAKNPVIGTKKTIARMNRNQIVGYFKKYYTPNNVIVSVSGDARNVIEKITKIFGDLRREKLPKSKKIKEPKDKKPTIKREKKKILHSYLVIGYKAPSVENKDTYAMEVIRAILGKGQSSRLFNEIRTKRGLGYIVGAEYVGKTDYGYFASFVSADRKNIPICRDILLKEFKLPDLTNKEVEEAKNYVIGSLILKNETNSERSEFNAALEMDKTTLKGFIKGVKAVKFRDIKKAVKKYFNKNYTEVFLEQR